MNTKVIVLSPVVGDNFSHPASKKQVPMEISIAFKLALNETVKFVDQQLYNKMLKEHNDKLQKTADEEAEKEAIKKHDHFRAELNTLCLQVVMKAAEVNGKNLSEQEIVDGTEELLSIFLEERQDESKEEQGFFSSLLFGKK